MARRIVARPRAVPYAEMYSYDRYDQRVVRSAGTVSASLSRSASLGLRFPASSITEATHFANRPGPRAATGAGAASPL